MIDEELLNPLRKEIRSIIFPDRSLNNRTAQNDQSDLTHLAYCAKNKVGFITSERAILRQAIKLKEEYGITVVSPAEIDFGVTADESITVETDNESLEIKAKNASNEIKLEQFLKNIGLSNTLIESINSRTQAITNIKEKVAVINENIIGYCGWNIPNSLSTQIDCYLYVNESNNQAVKVIDHFIESILRDTCSHKITRLDLHIEEKQSLTKSTAKKKGFLSTNNKNILTKVAFNGFITNESWKDFIAEFSQITNRIYPTKLPKYRDLVNTGIRVQEKTNIHSNCISLFNFESIISPGVILHNERNCLLIPIKESYANDLLGCENRQLSWIPSKSNSLLLEKAYFKSIRMSSYFKKGGLIAFYVSGKKSRQEIIGTARITYTDILKIEQVDLAIHRQGVLSKKDLQKLINKQGKLHTFTFDNFKEFPYEISFKKAKEIGLISGANLVTVEELSFQQLNLLLKTAYNL